MDIEKLLYIAEEKLPQIRTFILGLFVILAVIVATNSLVIEFEFEGHYSFERKEVNGFDVLVHRRDFFGMIGDIYEAHVYLENGKVLILADELDHERLDDVLSTISN